MASLAAYVRQRAARAPLAKPARLHFRAARGQSALDCLPGFASGP
ncbi:hypothetical protein RSPO_c03066 [Ralstonia solanacearum Po82]|uniref:Uncharacterized protein n=1 Tax=Ralstonia solanacearum (strain Po82) TaxID=1031711 RepID=F6G5J3_RALS8|nr:hypothetical protein RSPO_c03066 [Ralstonia solanacearum Po82]